MRATVRATVFVTGATTAEVKVNIKLSEVRRLLRQQAGQGLAEYALILALIGVLSIVALTFMGGSINTLLSDLGKAM